MANEQAGADNTHPVEGAYFPAVSPSSYGNEALRQEGNHEERFIDIVQEAERDFEWRGNIPWTEADDRKL